MRKALLSIALGLTLMIALIGAFQVARSQSGTDPGGGELKLLAQETEGDNTREITGPADSVGITPQTSAPNIGFIDLPTSTCYQPDPAQDTCYINWYYISVSASPNYIISMTVDLNAFGQVIRYAGFFQTSMYAPDNMQDRGIKVACGKLGAGGNPYWAMLTPIPLEPGTALALTQRIMGPSTAQPKSLNPGRRTTQCCVKSSRVSSACASWLGWQPSGGAW